MVMKNCEPLVFLPALAIERIPGLVCLSWKFSSVGERSNRPHRRTSIDLTCELFAIDGLATGTIVPGEVTSLEHEVGDDTVEARASVSETVLAGGELAEVFGGLGHYVVVQLEGDTACIFAVDGDIKLDPL